MAIQDAKAMGVPVEGRDGSEAVELLRRLVAEIAADDYRAKIGSPLTNNTAYLAAVAFLELRDLLERGHPGAG